MKVKDALEGKAASAIGVGLVFFIASPGHETQIINGSSSSNGVVVIRKV